MENLPKDVVETLSSKGFIAFYSTDLNKIYCYELDDIAETRCKNLKKKHPLVKIDRYNMNKNKFIDMCWDICYAVGGDSYITLKNTSDEIMHKTDSLIAAQRLFIFN